MESRKPRGLCLALAMFLPILAAQATVHFSILHSVPFAVSLICVAGVAIFGEIAPTLLACLSAGISHAVLVARVLGWPLLGSQEFVGFCLILVLALALHAIDIRRRRASRDLQAAVEAFQESTATLIEAQQASKCASWTYDSTDRTRWQTGGFEVFGIPFSQLEQLASPISLIYPEDQDRVRAAARHMVATRGPLMVEYRVLFPDGGLHWSEARGTPVPGKPNLWRGVTFDITDRKLAETALIRSEKLAAMGRLASTVAHEVNNPLEAVTNLLYLARMDRNLAPETQTYLATAEAELGRLANITRLTLGFVRSNTSSREVEVAGVFDEILAIFRHNCEMKGIRIERIYQPGVTITIAPHELRQIVTNLISNATDALSGSECRIRAQIFQEAETAILLFEDNGTGIPRQNLNRIFEPFFSTKEDIGTGIGLWVTRELVEKYGGRISVESGELANGMRTCFRVELPVASRHNKLEEVSAEEISSYTPAPS